MIKFTTMPILGLIWGRTAFCVIMLTVMSVFFSCGTVVERPDLSSVIIEKVPFYPQEDYQCGPSSLAGVMNYWGIESSPEDIARDIYKKSVKGTLSMDMVIYPVQKGLQAVQYSGGWDDLKSKITEHYPLIVLVDFGFFVYQSNHFMVVVGYSDSGVIVNSGRAKQMHMDRDAFLSAWKRTNFWTLWIRKT